VETLAVGIGPITRIIRTTRITRITRITRTVRTTLGVGIGPTGPAM